MSAPAPGVVYPTPNREWERWNTQYTNNDNDGSSPNYPRSIGRLVAGLLQQQPVGYAEPDTGPLGADTLADLTDRAVKRAAAESVVFLRPAMVNGRWVPSVLHAGNVEAVWSHEQLVEATTWTLVDGDGDQGRLVIVEHSTYGEKFEWEVSLWTASKDTSGGWKLGERLEIENKIEGEPALYAELREMEQRRLVAFPFDFEDGRPVPIHYTNEHLVDRLNQMHKVEDQDDAVPRNILGVSGDSFNETTASNGRGVTGRIRGMIEGLNVIKIPGDRMAQHGTKGVVEAVHMESDLIMREKIRMKVDDFYEACGIAPQTFGRSVSGASDSGAAKRADSQLTLTTIAGPARRWAQALTDISNEIARLANETAQPVAVTEGLKSSADERAEMIRTLRDADAMSIREAVKQTNPGWDDATVDAEVDAIRADSGLATPPDLM